MTRIILIAAALALAAGCSGGFGYRAILLGYHPGAHLRIDLDETAPTPCPTPPAPTRW